MRLRAGIAIALSIISLACIGYGCAMIYWPAACIAVGVLIWIDLVAWGWMVARSAAAKAERDDGSEQT